MKNSQETDADRLTKLELALMHLQNDYDSLNQMVLKNGSRLDEVLGMLQRVTDKLESQQHSIEPQVRKAEDEKPPHY
jgi:uncharacterized coiled-coil protein SlyX